jgi:hypothetical protein
MAQPRGREKLTWLKVLPLYTPMIEPIISGTMIIFRKCVLTGSGFSPEGASLLALRSFLIRAKGLRFSPLWNLQDNREASARNQVVMRRVRRCPAFLSSKMLRDTGQT